MPNLYSYLELCYYISDNKSVFFDMYRDNVQSTSKFFNQLEFNYEFTKKIEQRLLYGGTNILSVDLSNFYHTLYTHSIPWVIEGKQASKAKRFGGVANEVDSILQQCQYGETHGVPTGNLATRLITELYMCYIDKRMLKKGYTYSRYVDDIKFTFSTESQKESFLTDFSKICRENNLIINDKKTSENPFPFTNNREKTEIFNYFDGLNKKNKSSSWIKKINEFWKFCIGEEAQGNKGAIKCMFSVVLNALRKKEIGAEKLTEIFITKESYTRFNLYEMLLDTSLKDSRLTNRLMSFTEEIIKRGVNREDVLSIVGDYLDSNCQMYREKLRRCINNNWNQEVYQILLYCVVFEHSSLLGKDDIENVISIDMDDYSICLAIIIWIKNGWAMYELLSILDHLLTETHMNYPERNNNRMSEKFWLTRYFIYYLIDHTSIFTDGINEYYQSVDASISELNKEYTIPKNEASPRINNFYNYLLDHKIPLIQLGKNNDFVYL